jgi:hypothetical protein
MIFFTWFCMQARFYHNEGQVAQVIAKSCAIPLRRRTRTSADGQLSPRYVYIRHTCSGIPRSEIFFTTKVFSSEHGTSATSKAIEESLSTIKTCGDYFDLILLHDPGAGAKKRLEAYNVLLKAKKEGKVRDIGVSNYGPKHLKEIEDAGLELPGRFFKISVTSAREHCYSRVSKGD